MNKKKSLWLTAVIICIILAVSGCTDPTGGTGEGKRPPRGDGDGAWSSMSEKDKAGIKSLENLEWEGERAVQKLTDGKPNNDKSVITIITRRTKYAEDYSQYIIQKNAADEDYAAVEAFSEETTGKSLSKRLEDAKSIGDEISGLLTIQAVRQPHKIH